MIYICYSSKLREQDYKSICTIDKPRSRVFEKLPEINQRSRVFENRDGDRACFAGVSLEL